MDRAGFPQPSPQQARLIWLAVTALSLALFVAVLGALFWAMGWVLQRLTPVLLPLAIAGIIAYLLDPLVDVLERTGLRRSWSILLVFLIGVGVVVGICAFLVPRLIGEIKDLGDRIPDY